MAPPHQADEHRVVVVHRHPGAVVQVLGELALRRLRPERQHEIGEAPVGPARLGLAIGGVHRAGVGVGDVVFRGAVGHREAEQAVFRHDLRVDAAGMQKAEMRGVDIAFQRLQPVALALHERDRHLALRQQGRLDLRQRRRLRALAHIDPDKAVALRDRVRLGLDAVLEIRHAGEVRRIDAIAVRVELPAVIDAAYAVLLVAPEEQRGAAVRAFMVHDPDPPGAVAERDQFLAEQHRGASGRRRPSAPTTSPPGPSIAASIRPSIGARPDPDEILAVLPVHRDSSRQFGFRTNPNPSIP